MQVTSKGQVTFALERMQTGASAMACFSTTEGPNW
jgi:hypothetical protein